MSGSGQLSLFRDELAPLELMVGGAHCAAAGERRIGAPELPIRDAFDHGYVAHNYGDVRVTGFTLAFAGPPEDLPVAIGPAYWGALDDGLNEGTWAVRTHVLTGPRARLEPQLAIGRLAEGYARAVGSAALPIVRNPIEYRGGIQWSAADGATRMHSMGELAAEIPRGWRAPGLDRIGDILTVHGRRSALIRATKATVGRAHGRGREIDVHGLVCDLNGRFGSHPLGPTTDEECARLAAQVLHAMRTWVKVSDRFRAKQARRGRKGGLKSRGGGRVRVDDATAALVLADLANGLSQRRSAEGSGIDEATVRRIVARS